MIRLLWPRQVKTTVNDPAFTLAYGEKPLLTMMPLTGRSFNNRTLPDFLGTLEVNGVIPDVPLRLALIPLKIHRSLCHIMCTQSTFGRTVRPNPRAAAPMDCLKSSQYPFVFC